MATCPNGHENPTDWEFCGNCGAPIEAVSESTTTQRWYRTRWFISATIVAAVLLIAGGVAAVVVAGVTNHSGSSEPTTLDTAAIQQWWSVAHEPFTELQNAIDDSQRALDRLDGGGLASACQRMHDSGEIELQAHMPTPDPELTSELRAVIEDIHSAAHMCLSVVAGTINNYDGEFMSYVDQAEIHMTAAQDMINKTLTQA